MLTGQLHEALLHRHALLLLNVAVVHTLKEQVAGGAADIGGCVGVTAARKGVGSMGGEQH
jgi:hypothetical protein